VSENASNYRKLFLKCVELYDVRELPGCFVINGKSGSLVIYQNGDHKSVFTVCKGEKREVVKMDAVSEVIERLAQ
jgi:hypothetical protein